VTRAGSVSHALAEEISAKQLAQFHQRLQEEERFASWRNWKRTLKTQKSRKRGKNRTMTPEFTVVREEVFEIVDTIHYAQVSAFAVALNVLLFLKPKWLTWLAQRQKKV
jgi:regulator of PEP synthase PpsR (kinase-PPPase family)